MNRASNVTSRHRSYVCIPGEESIPADARLADEMIGCKPPNPTLCIPLTALAAPSLPRLHKLSVRKRVMTLVLLVVLVIHECDPLIVAAVFEQRSSWDSCSVVDSVWMRRYVMFVRGQDG